jgi:hypothetical protein
MNSTFFVMDKSLRLSIWIILLLLSTLRTNAQDTTALRNNFEERYTHTVDEKITTFNSQVDTYTQKMLAGVISQEQKMQKKVARVDSAKARSLFQYSIDSLKKFESHIKEKAARVSRFLGGGYFPYLDTLKQSLSFLHKADGAMNQASAAQDKLTGSLASVDQMESKLQTVDQIDEYLKQRQEVLQSQLSSFPVVADGLKGINKEAVYYQAQIGEYKAVLSNPDKIEAQVLKILQSMPAFQKYFAQNSQFSGLFANPANFATAGVGTTPIVNGLPSRAALQQFMHQQMPGTEGDPTQQIQQQVQNQGQSGDGASIPGLDALQNKTGLGSGQFGNATAAGFIPNPERTKSFGKRLEYGFNVQFGSSTNLLPASSTIGVQIGYKFSDKASMGIGASYSLGLGTGWNHIRLSNNSLGGRSYFKWKAKKAFFLQAEADQNYMSAFSSIAELRNFNAWQTSAMAGIGKEYKVGKKLNGSALLLYDFLYQTHTPITQPLSFRFGYNF